MQITLKVEEWHYVMQILSERPFKEVAPILLVINRQLQESSEKNED